MSTTNTATTNTEELFALAPYIAGLDASNDVDAFTSAPRRCPGGCYGGLVADPRGPSTHNPTGLRECPVCG